MKTLSMIVLFMSISMSMQAQDQSQIVFYETPPTWPGCTGNATELQKCFKENLTKHIISNYTFPENYVQGEKKQRVVIKFIINEEGMVEITESTGGTPEMRKEAERNILSIPKMTPGHMKGMNKSTSFTVPFTY